VLYSTVAGDGNCMYAAILKQLGMQDDDKYLYKHDELRLQVRTINTAIRMFLEADSCVVFHN
jgi:hypothetical protein